MFYKLFSDILKMKTFFFNFITHFRILFSAVLNQMTIIMHGLNSVAKYGKEKKQSFLSNASV